MSKKSQKRHLDGKHTQTQKHVRKTVVINSSRGYGNEEWSVVGQYGTGSSLMYKLVGAGVMNKGDKVEIFAAHTHQTITQKFQDTKQTREAAQRIGKK